MFVFLAGITAGMIVAAIKGYFTYYHKLQLKTAGDILAGDIRLLQQQSMFSDGILNRQLKFMPDGSGYAFYKERKISKKVYFSSVNCSEVYIARKITYVQFTNSGAPSYTGNIVLRHRKDAAISCTLALQPVTGRVVLSEQ